MPVSEEEQVRMMLEAMGASSIEEIEAEAPKYTPPEQPVVSSEEPQEPASPVQEQAFIDRTLTLHEPVKREPPHGAPREITVPMLIRLLGLPNANQLSVIELKLDSLTSKVAALSSKLDRISKSLDHGASEVTLDRIDFQLSTIRSMLRRGPGEAAAAADMPPPPKKAKVLTSTPSESQASAPTPSSNEPLLPVEDTAPPTKPAPEPDALEELSTFPDDATFQRGEAQRVRTTPKPR